MSRGNMNLVSRDYASIISTPVAVFAENEILASQPGGKCRDARISRGVHPLLCP